MKLDLGCGKNKREGFVGVDRIQFDGVDVVTDLGKNTWPWEDGSVEEAFSSHSVEHLDQAERIHFFNELHRVLVPGGTAQIITPHWANARAYGDPTHKWPAISDWFYNYLQADWRKSQAPHTDIEHNPLGYSCDFQTVLGVSWDQNDSWISLVHQDAKFVRLSRNINTCTDLIANLTKRKPDGV